MKRPLRSFRGRLFAAFLAAALVPLLVCSGFLLQTFRVRLTDDAAEQAQDYLRSALSALDGAFEGYARARETLDGNAVIAEALRGGEGADDTDVYAQLFSATGAARDYAYFDLYDLEGVWRYSTANSSGASTLSTGWGVLAQARRAGELVFSATDDPSDITTPQLWGAAPLADGRGREAGFLVIRVYQSHLRALLEGKYGGQNDLLLLSRYWRPIYCAQPTLAASLAPQLRALLLSGEDWNDISEEFVYSVTQHPGTGLYLVLRQPQVFTRDTMTLLYTVSISVAAASILLAVALSLVLSRPLSMPVRRLTQAMSEVREEGDLDVRVSPVGSDELGQLSAQFNDMVSALKENRQELLENQRELNEAQIRMLQAQLNPHFLCNTLDTMKWISKINNVPQVSEMSASLADILRYAISDQELVPLWRDEEILERYVQIQTVRLSGGFTFSSRIPEELAACLVPRLLLQPLVENAILHGLEGVEKGEIAVTAQREGETLVVTVTDNGRGFPQALLGPYAPNGKPEGHLGLYNVDTILRKYFGPGYGLTLSNPPGGGAEVTARLPILREEEDASC